MTRIPDPGELQRRIVIRLWTDAPATGWGLDAEYDAGMSRWAKVEPVHGLAIRYGQQTEDVPTHLFWVRYGPGTKPEDITTAHVVEWSGQRYRVLDAINIDDRQVFTRISAKHLGAI